MYTVTIMSAVSAASNLTTDSTIFEFPQGFNGCKHTCEKGLFSLQVIAASLDQADATIKVQHSDSDNGSTFVDVENGSISLTANGTYTLTFANVCKQYYRLVYAKGTNTTGTVTSTITFS